MTKLIPRYQTPFSSLNTISYFNSDGTPVWQSKKKQKKAKAGDFVTESLKAEVEKSSENTAGQFTTDMNTGGHATKHVDPYDNMTDIQRMQYEAKQHPTSEIVSYVGRDGQVHSAPTANGALDPEDPIASLYLADKVATPVLKLAGKGMLYGLGRWGEGRVQNWARGKLISDAMNEAELNGYKLTTPEFMTRFKYGDVEINDPNLNYRQGSIDMVKDFLNSGKVRVDYPNKENTKLVETDLGTFNFGKSFENPMFRQGNLWYDADVVNGSDASYPGLLVTREPLQFATKAARVAKKDMSGRRIPFSDDQLNLQNTTGYIYQPGYGFKRVPSNTTGVMYKLNRND